jgi:hypothetical protein
MLSSETPCFGESKLLPRSQATEKFQVDKINRWIMWCYDTGERGALSPQHSTSGANFPCGVLTRKPSPGELRGTFIPAIGQITPELYLRSKNQATEQFRTFVCDRMKIALLGVRKSSTGACPIGEQFLSPGLFMSTTSDVTKEYLTVIAEVYGRSEYLAVRREKYWEKYRFSFQAVQKSLDETMVIIAIDEAKEEKNGDDKKLITFRSPIGAEHTKEVEALFNRITSVTLGD